MRGRLAAPPPFLDSLLRAFRQLEARVVVLVHRVELGRLEIHAIREERRQLAVPVRGDHRGLDDVTVQVRPLLLDRVDVRLEQELVDRVGDLRIVDPTVVLVVVGAIVSPSTKNMKLYGCGKSWNQFVKPVWAFVLSLPTVWK